MFGFGQTSNINIHITPSKDRKTFKKITYPENNEQKLIVYSDDDNIQGNIEI